MTLKKQDLLNKLKELATWRDREAAHAEADRALLAYINDPEIAGAFNSQEMWTA